MNQEIQSPRKVSHLVLAVCSSVFIIEPFVYARLLARAVVAEFGEDSGALEGGHGFGLGITILFMGAIGFLLAVVAIVGLATELRASRLGLRYFLTLGHALTVILLLPAFAEATLLAYTLFRIHTR